MGAVLRGPSNIQGPPAQPVSGLWTTCGRRGWGGGLELSVSSEAGASGRTDLPLLGGMPGRRTRQRALFPSLATFESGPHSPGACVLGVCRCFCDAGSHSDGGGVPWLLGLSRAHYTNSMAICESGLTFPNYT